MNWVSLVFLLFLPLIGSCAPPPEHQDAVVSAVYGSPCFSFSKEAKNSASSVVSVLTIYERKEGRAVELWKHVYPRGNLPGKLLSADECIAYDRIAFPAAPLLTSGRSYNVVMTAAVPHDGKLSRRWYEANFCMIDAGGKLVPHQVLWDKRRELWAWDRCGLPAGQ